MKNNWTDKDLKLYSSMFNLSFELVGQRINDIQFYLDSTDIEFTEQPNEFGKSLLNGFDIFINETIYSIGNRFTDAGYGLIISKGRTSEIEFIEEDKKAISFPTNLIGQIISRVDIYWMPIPWTGAVGYYPQEIMITTKNGILLISSIEVNQGKVNTEFTNELLIIDNKKIAELLHLGQFGFKNGREYFKSFDELYEQDKKNWC